MQINQRQKSLIQLLLSHSKPLHGSEISQRINTTTRTLRQDIATINTFFHQENLQIYSNPSKGYWIEENDKTAFINYIKESKNDLIPANQNQREIAICFYLLEHDYEYTSMGLLADLFYVSKTTISNTIKHIEEIVMASKGLQLSISAKKGLQILGSEYAKRNLYSSIILLFYELKGTYINRYIVENYDELHNFETLYQILMSYLTQIKIMLTNKSLMIITNELLISAYRNRIQQKNIEAAVDSSASIDLPFDDIERLLKLKFSEYDKQYLNQLVAKKRRYNAINTNEEAIDVLTNKIIDEFYEAALLSFGLQLHQQQPLTEHLSAMIYYHTTVTHSEFNDLINLKLTHPFAYQVASLMNPIIKEYTDKLLTENELNSLTARLSVILDGNIKKLNIIILTDLSTSLTELLKTELNLYFGQLLTISGIYPLYRAAAAANHDQIDLILATSREASLQGYDILHISPVLTMDDTMKIFAYIRNHVPSSRCI